MCPPSTCHQIKAFYVSDEITEIALPTELENLPELGNLPETGIIGYIIISNGEEITIITNEQEYLQYIQQNI